MRLISDFDAPRVLATARQLDVADATSFTICFGVPFAQSEIAGNLYDKPDVTGPVVGAYFRSKDPLFDIDGHRIEIEGGRQRPAVPALPEKPVIAQMIVIIGDENVKGHPPVKCAGIFGRLGAAGLRVRTCRRSVSPARSSRSASTST